MAETGLEIHELDRQSVQNALVESVIKAYYNALLAEEHIKIARESVSSVETQLRMMRVRYEGGGALKSDILSLEVRLARAREDLVRARNNRSLAIAALANLLGLDPDSTLVLKSGEALVTELPKDYRTGVPYALAHRPELRGARLRIIQARMDLDAARAEYLPRLDGEARYYMDDPDMTFETGRANWTAGVILNWDVFTGLSTKAKMKRKTNVLEEMLAVDRKTTLAVQLDLKTAYLRLSEARARVAVTDASVAQAEESLRLVKKEYEGGSVTITRYLETELARNRARMRASVAFYDKEKAAAAVGRALGLWAAYAEEVMVGDE
jgi:outer membrane protein TolC